MKKKTLIILCSVIILIAIITTIILTTNKNAKNNQLGTEDNSAIKEMVNNYSTTTETTELAWITSKELIVEGANGKEVKYDLPKDEFYLAIAPYYNETHPCKDHYLTECKSELVDEEFLVTITDETGKTVIDEMMKSTNRGFINLWLPRDHKYNVTVKHNTKSVTQTLSTYKNDDTCFTDIMRLK